MSSKKKSLDTIYPNLLCPENKLILPISPLKLPMKSIRIFKFAGDYHFEIAHNPPSFNFFLFFLLEKTNLIGQVFFIVQ